MTTIAPPRLRQIESIERKADSLSHLALAAFVGFVAASAWYHVPRQQQEHAQLVTVEKKEIPTLKKQAAAEHAKAEDAQRTVGVLVQEINSTQGRPDAIDPAPVPKPKPPR